ncbi:MAG: hypothetical protein PVH29_04925 [Candidatus Zixiibacteriota bacterium]|jgi:hypothetical protein
MRLLFIATALFGAVAPGYGESVPEPENPPPLQALILGAFYSLEEQNGSNIYNVNLDTGEISPLLKIEGFKITGCCLSKDHRYILIYGYYYGSYSSAIILFEINTNNKGYTTKPVFEKKFDEGSRITSVYDKQETRFYIAVTDRGEPGSSVETTYEPYYRKTGKTGDTALYNYRSGSTELELVTTLPFFSEIEAGYPEPDKLYVFYEEYPYARRLGLLNTRDGSVAFLYPWSDHRFIFLNDPCAFSEDGLKKPVSYWCIPAIPDGYNDTFITYLFYSTSSHNEAVGKIGDAVLLPVMFSRSRGELLFLVYQDGETVLINYPLKESTPRIEINLPRELGTHFRLMYVK